MAAVGWHEARLAVGGALRLARGDPQGLACFDVSLDGFWHSFRAALICYPFYLFLISLRVSAAHWAEAGAGRIMLVETIGYVIAWVAYPLLTLPLTRWLDREARFLVFMVAYNWSQVPQTALFLVSGIDVAAGPLPLAAAQLLDLAAAIAALVYEWYVARVALAISGGQAVVFVLVDLLLSALLSRVTAGLY
jgi:hypothetical protein